MFYTLNLFVFLIPLVFLGSAVLVVLRLAVTDPAALQSLPVMFRATTRVSQKQRGQYRSLIWHHNVYGEQATWSVTNALRAERAGLRPGGVCRFKVRRRSCIERSDTPAVYCSFFSAAERALELSARECNNPCARAQKKKREIFTPLLSQERNRSRNFCEPLSYPRACNPNRILSSDRAIDSKRYFANDT